MKPVVLDGWLWVIIGGSGAAIAELGSETAFKYINPYLLFWAKFYFSVQFASATSLKTYRSTTYAKHLDDQKTEKALTDGSSNATVTSTETKTTATEVKPNPIEPEKPL